MIKFYDSYIFGESDALDCPPDHPCSCVDKVGLSFFSNNNGGKDLHIDSKSARPIHKIKTFGAFGGVAEIDNVTFAKFNQAGKTKCLKRGSIFGRNKWSSDKIPIHYFNNCKFQNVDDDSVAYFEDPDNGWANTSDCGQFPCTAPNNVLLSFTNTKYSGTTPIAATSNFQIIPDDPNIGGKVGAAWSSCSLKKAW